MAHPDVKECRFLPLPKTAGVYVESHIRGFVIIIIIIIITIIIIIIIIIIIVVVVVVVVIIIIIILLLLFCYFENRKNVNATF